MHRSIALATLLALSAAAPTLAHAQPSITPRLYQYDFSLPAGFTAWVQAPFVSGPDSPVQPRFALLVQDPQNVRHETDIALSFFSEGTLLQTVGGLQCGAVVSCRYSALVNSAVFEAFRSDPLAVSVRLTGTTTLQGQAPLAFTVSGLGVEVASAVVPEPGTWALLGTGLVALGAVARRRRRA